MKLKKKILTTDKEKEKWLICQLSIYCIVQSGVSQNHGKMSTKATQRDWLPSSQHRTSSLHTLTNALIRPRVSDTLKHVQH